jgi:hypothetical protein
VAVDDERAGPWLNEALVGFDGPGPRAAVPLIRALHPAYVRTDVDFNGTAPDGTPLYNCATGSFDFAELDARVAAIHAEGAIPELIVDYMPPCLATSAPSASAWKAPPDPGPHTAAWDALVEEMARHEIAQGVRVFEVWNEPDWLFFSGTVADYARLYANTVAALETAARQAHVRIEVGGPALANVLGTMDVGWLEGFLRQVAADHLPLDFLSWHLYANDPCAGPQQGIGPIDFACFGNGHPPGSNEPWYLPSLAAGLFAREAAQARRVLAQFPSLHPALVVDEWNVDGEYDPRQQGPYGAAYVAAVLDASEQAGIAWTCYFDVWNAASDPDANFGVLRPDFEPAPAWFAFRFWSRLAGRTLPVRTSGPGAGDPLGPGLGGVVAVATRGADGRVRVLLANFVPFDPSGNYGTSPNGPHARRVVLVVRHVPAGFGVLGAAGAGSLGEAPARAPSTPAEHATSVRATPRIAASSTSVGTPATADTPTATSASLPMGTPVPVSAAARGSTVRAVLWMPEESVALVELGAGRQPARSNQGPSAAWLGGAAGAVALLGFVALGLVRRRRRAQTASTGGTTSVSGGPVST